MNKDWETRKEELSEKSNKKGFSSWIKSKDYIGFNQFDEHLYKRAFYIKQQLYNDNDHFVCVTGREGAGKSTCALNLAFLIDPTFNINRVCYEFPDFIRCVKDAERGQVIILDEGNQFLFSREAMSGSNVQVVKLFALMRQKNLCIIICVPNFFTLDTYNRNHRIDTLLYANKRGHYAGYIGNAIKVISRDGRHNKQVVGHKIPMGTYWKGYFVKSVPEINGFTLEEYQKHKKKHFDAFLSKLNEDNESKYMTVKEFTKKVPISERSVQENLAKGILKGKKLNGRWFIPRDNEFTADSTDNFNIEGEKE